MPDLFCLLQGLLGDHYGHQTVPRLIEEEEFEALALQLSGDSAQLLTERYRQDENALPTGYVLQPADGQAWQRLERRLAPALRLAAQKAERRGLLSPEQRHCYHKSDVFRQGPDVLLTFVSRQRPIVYNRKDAGKEKTC